MARIGIVTCSNCTQDTNCASVVCLADMRKRRGFFERYPKDEPLDLVGIINCAGCPTLAAPEKILKRVRAVATLGSPFSGDPRLNNVWRLYESVAGHKVDDPPIPNIVAKPPVPTLAIWSPRDGIVSPRAARGLKEESDKVVALNCCHMAFGVSRSAADKVVQEIDTFLKDVAE